MKFAQLLTLFLLLLCGTVQGQSWLGSSGGKLIWISDGRLAQSSDLIRITNYASHTGIVAAGGLAEIKGEAFTEQSAYFNQPGDLPKELDGVVVAIDGELCGLRMVEAGKIVAAVPQFPVNTAYRFGWKIVEVKTADGRLLVGWTVVRPVAPGIVMENGHPQGLWNVAGTEVVGVIGQSDIPNGATLALTGSGFGKARRVVAFLMTDTSWFMTVAVVGPFAVPMEGLQTISFDLPPQIVGEVGLVIFADGAWTQEVGLLVGSQRWL